MTTDLAGRCMCGGVAFTISSPFRDVFNCHCDRCRPFSGHHVAATAVVPDNLAFDRDETLAWYEPADGVYYGFCSTCGSSLFFRTDATTERISVMAGSLLGPTGLATTQAWWVDHAAGYHQLPTNLIDHPLDG